MAFLNPREVIDYLVKKGCLKSDITAADFGCGSGFFTILIAEKVGKKGKVLAIDILDDALKETKELAELTNIKNIEYILADLEKESSIKPDSVDFVLISNILFQADDKLAILKEAYRILKKGGYVFVLEWKPDVFFYKNQTLLEKEKIIDLLTQANFKIIEKQYQIDTHFGILAKK